MEPVTGLAVAVNVLEVTEVVAKGFNRMLELELCWGCIGRCGCGCGFVDGTGGGCNVIGGLDSIGRLMAVGFTC